MARLYFTVYRRDGHFAEDTVFEKSVDSHATAQLLHFIPSSISSVMLLIQSTCVVFDPEKWASRARRESMKSYGWQILHNGRDTF